MILHGMWSIAILSYLDKPLKLDDSSSLESI